MTSEVVPSLAPLRKTVAVPIGQSRAFELFTARIGEWWPLATHSVGLEDALRVTFPGEVGGAIVETLRDGTTCVWGTLTGWDPPAGVSFTWHPGQHSASAGDVEVRFVADGTERTVVELTHSGWQRRADGAEARGGYDSGWEVVLGRYGSVAAA
jgi:uncharacterized protein YndB with AHSA1/START domain